MIGGLFLCSDSSTALPISFDIRRKARSRRVRVTGFVRRSRTRRRIQNDGKWPCVPHTDTILHLKLDTRTPSTRNGHKLLSQRPRRFDRLLQVPEEERRVGAADDAVVARQSDHHSFFDAHARQSFRQVDYLRFRRSYS